MIAEPWNTLLYLIIVPGLIQLFRYVADKTSKPIPIGVVQAIAALLAIVFVFLNGGFAGIEIPVYAGDPIGFVTVWLTLLVAAWGPVELLYRIVWKALYEKVGLA